MTLLGVASDSGFSTPPSGLITVTRPRRTNWLLSESPSEGGVDRLAVEAGWSSDVTGVGASAEE